MGGVKYDAHDAFIMENWSTPHDATSLTFISQAQTNGLSLLSLPLQCTERLGRSRYQSVASDTASRIAETVDMLTHHRIHPVVGPLRSQYSLPCFLKFLVPCAPPRVITRTFGVRSMIVALGCGRGEETQVPINLCWTGARITESHRGYFMRTDCSGHVIGIACLTFRIGSKPISCLSQLTTDIKAWGLSVPALE